MNPELRRNLWLELGAHRLLALPVGFVLLILVIRAMAGEDASRAIAWTAVVAFVGFTAIWGATQAGESVLGELRGRTWDGQRLSSLDPWTMTWGKLFGATAFAWYGGLMCIGAYLVCAPEPSRLARAGLMLAGAVLLHALALIGGITAARRGLLRSSATGWMIGLAFVFVWPLASWLVGGEADVQWWGSARTRIDFLLVSSIAFAGWSVFGAHRLMCQELRVRTTPWAWVAFLLFVAGYVSGFGIRADDSLRQQAVVFLIAGLIVTLSATYPLLATEASGSMVVRRLLLRIGERDWRRALQETPLWPVTLALGAVFCVLTVLLAGARAPERWLFGAVVLAPVPLFLLVLRDCALYMFFALARRPRRAEAATVFYLVLLYWLVPMLLNLSGAGYAADFVLPPFWSSPVQASLVAAVQAGLIAAGALWRWRRNYGS